MTFIQFKRQVTGILQEKFVSQEFSPLKYGIERAVFEERKLKRLISAAEQADCLTAQRRKQAWLRQLEKTGQNRSRLEKMQQEISTVGQVLRVAVAPTAKAPIPSRSTTLQPAPVFSDMKVRRAAKVNA